VNETTEQTAMECHLAKTPCLKCGGEIRLTDAVYYTNPLNWQCKCTNCEATGTVRYTSIPIIEFPEDSLPGLNLLKSYDEILAYRKKYGVERPRQIQLDMT
jgi:hypothetical protein